MNAEEDQHASATESPGNSNGAVEQSGNVERIRNILFGNQMRDYDGRFQKLEERLVREGQELRADLQKRLEALEGFMKGEIEAMSGRVHAEHRERIQMCERLGRDLAETARGLEARIEGLDERTAKDLRDLRQQLLEQSKALGAEMKDRHEQMKAGLADEARQIRGAMTGREALSEMFSEVALRLKNDFQVPGAS